MKFPRAVWSAAVVVTTTSWTRRASRAFSTATVRRPFTAAAIRGGGPPDDRTCAAAGTRVLHSTMTDAVTAPPTEIWRTDYTPLPYTVSHVELDVNIHEGRTVVTSRLTVHANPRFADTKTNPTPASLTLDGDETSVALQSVTRNGQRLQADVDYTVRPGALVLDVADGDVLQLVVHVVPETNTQLSGLYKSGPMYCTQCEAMGFRRITYFPDRPDNMATFRVRIEADKDDYPVLLSNGNCIEQGTVVATADDTSDPTARHYAVWSDPFPKPSYLFAAVAGNLGRIHDTYTTRPSGRVVQLQLFSDPADAHKLQYAMDSLKRAMQWDEDRFGLEYDLDVYNIVATTDFNMGAMENKGLNIFNTALTLADRETATDSDFERVEGVIGHEYFHNWTGNRVTCRDWFQLTLKEGLTVFRDQEFSGDMNSKAVNRIENVRGLRARQFREDASPMAHPIRPESYVAMDNFYTATVYEKGAEIIRMYQTILSTEGFNKGMKLYFDRHDGQAVTCDDFLSAMADANDVDLSQFSLWYSTPGTPVVKYAHSYDDQNGVFTLNLSQSSQSDKPLHIPIAIGLLDKETGEEVLPTKVLDLTSDSQTFTFDGLKGDVVPSLLRTFSAPIKLLPESGDTNEADLAFLAARDTDGFNRWEAGQKLYTSLIFQTLDDKVSETTQDFVYEAFGRALADKETKDYSIQAYTLILPSEGTLAEEMQVVDPIGIHTARGTVKKALARKFQTELVERYNELTDSMEGEDFKVDAESIGKRRLRNVFLDYLCSIAETEQEQETAAQLATAHFEKATGMTDKMAALTALASMKGKGAAARDAALETFYNDANGDALVLNKWFMTQAMADLPDVLDRVKALTKHPDFTLKNPNRLRSLVSAFTMNAAAFHQEGGAGYEFLANVVKDVDALNPQISSRLAGSLITWRRYDEARGSLMKDQLEKLASTKLSEDLYEIVNKGL